MKDLASPLGITSLTSSFGGYTVTITSPESGDELNWGVLAPTVTVTPAAPGSTVINLYSGGSLVATGTLDSLPSFTPAATGTLVLVAEAVVDGTSNLSAGVTVTVVAPEVGMVSTGASFAPRIHLAAGDTTTTVLWTFADGTTSTSLTPTYTGTAGTHVLQVNPPTAVIEALNFGLVGHDDSQVTSPLAEFAHTPTNIVSCSNLQALTGLRRVLAEDTPALLGLDVSGLTNLITVDVYILDSIRTNNFTFLNVTGCTGLQRYCIENRAVQTLDLSTCPQIRDMRGRNQSGGTASLAITLPTSMPYVWHVCKGQSPNSVTGLTNILDGTIQTPSMLQWWLWYSRIQGTFAPRGTTNDVLCAVNRFSDISLANITWVGSVATRVIDFSYCGATINTLDLTGSGSVLNINFYNCNLTQALVDYILLFYATAGQQGGTLNLLNNAVPSATGLANRDLLLGLNWTVDVAA